MSRDRPSLTRALDFHADAQRTALAPFTLKNVLAQIAATDGNDGETAMQLWTQLVDTVNDKAHAVTGGPHCDDVLVNGVPSLNGFPIECPRPEGQLATVNPFKPPDQLDPNTMITRSGACASIPCRKRASRASAA